MGLVEGGLAVRQGKKHASDMFFSPGARLFAVSYHALEILRLRECTKYLLWYWLPLMVDAQIIRLSIKTFRKSNGIKILDLCRQYSQM